MKKQYIRKRYWRRAALRLGKQPKDYLEAAKNRFIVLINGTVPSLWEEDGTPRIYDTLPEALGWCLDTDTVITEYQFIKQYC